VYLDRNNKDSEKLGWKRDVGKTVMEQSCVGLINKPLLALIGYYLNMLLPNFVNRTSL